MMRRRRCSESILSGLSADSAGKNMRIGNARFDISVRYEHHMAEFSMKNRSTFPVYVEMQKKSKEINSPKQRREMESGL